MPSGKKATTEELFEGRSVPKTIISFAIPTVLGQIVSLIYNLADTFFVGHMNVPAQVAALTVSFPIYMVILLVGNLFGVGANSLISRSLGKKDRETAKKTSTFALWSGIALIVIVGIILHFSMTPLLKVVGASSEETLVAASEYLHWTVVFGGIPSVGVLLLGNLIRAEGNTRQSSIGTSLGGIINICIDPIFIYAFGMGAGGAGLATALSNLVSFIYLIIVIVRNKDSVIVLNPMNFAPSGYIAKEVILVGIPSAITIALGSTSNIFITHYMSGYGDVAVAAFGIVQKISTVVIQIALGLTLGIMPLLGFSFGSKNLKRVKEIVKWSIVILFTYAAVVFALIEIFPVYAAGVFTSEPQVVALAASFARRWMFCAFGMCSTHLFNSVFQAAGKWLYSLVLSCFRLGFPLIPLVYVLNKLMGMYGLVTAQPITDVLVVFLGVFMFVKLMKKIEKEYSGETDTVKA